MARTSRRTSSPPWAVKQQPLTARKARGVSTRPQRVAMVISTVAQNNGAIAVGTPRVNDLGAAVETAVGEQLEGAMIHAVQIIGRWRPTVTGSSQLCTAFFRGPSSLDVADLSPATDPGQNWLGWRATGTYGQRHLVATTPTLEFDEFRRTFWMRRKLRMRSFGDTLFFAEEVLGQDWEGAWSARIWYSGS